MSVPIRQEKEIATKKSKRSENLDGSNATRKTGFGSMPSRNEDWAGLENGGKNVHTYGQDGKNDSD